MAIEDLPLLERVGVAVEEMTMLPFLRQLIVDLATGVQSVRDLHSKSPLYNHAADCEICDNEDDAIADQHETFEGSDGDFLCGTVVVGYCCRHCTDTGDCGCYEPVTWPCETAQSVYSKEELA